MKYKTLLILTIILFCTPYNLFAQAEIRGGGVNGIELTADDLAYIAHMRDAGATGIRLYFLNPSVETHTETEYRAWIDNTVLPQMDTLVDLFANQWGLKILLSIHTAPGGRSTDGKPVDRVLIPGSSNQWMRDLLIESWGRIALRFNSLGDKVSYQLFSEPAPPADKSAWLELQEQLIDAIRDADSTPEDSQPRIFYMNLYGNPNLPKSVNLAARRGNMGILANMYTPFNYTHQDTPSATNDNVIKYPYCTKVGNAKSKRSELCTRAGLTDSLSKFKAYAKRNNLEMLMPEVAVSRTAPGATRYLTDVFKALKKLDIGWFYFTFTEAGNSPWRLTCDDATSTSTTCVPPATGESSSRQKVLERFFAELK